MSISNNEHVFASWIWFNCLLWELWIAPTSCISIFCPFLGVVTYCKKLFCPVHAEEGLSGILHGKVDENLRLQGFSKELLKSLDSEGIDCFYYNKIPSVQPGIIHRCHLNQSSFCYYLMLLHQLICCNLRTVRIIYLRCLRENVWEMFSVRYPDLLRFNAFEFRFRYSVRAAVFSVILLSLK